MLLRIAASTRARRQIFVDGAIADLGQEIIARTRGDEARDRALRIAEIAEMARSRWAGANASRLTILAWECFYPSSNFSPTIPASAHAVA